MNYTVEKDWIFEGLRCVVIMSSKVGFRCGYVGIGPDHPFYGKEYDEEVEVPSYVKDAVRRTELGKRSVMLLFAPALHEDKVSPELLLDVHGGLTYSRDSKDYPVENNDTWWFGYDCGHAGDGKDLTVVDDFIRDLEQRFPTGGIVRTLDYCVKECESLVHQLNTIKEIIDECSEGKDHRSI